MGIGLVGIVGVAYFVSNRMMFSNFVKGRKNKISEGESFEAHETVCLMCGDYKAPKQTYCCADCSRYSNERVNPLGGKRGGGFPRGDIAKAVLTLKEYGGEMNANQWKARIRDVRPTRKELNTNEIHKLVRYLNPAIYIKTEGKPLTYQITGGNCYDDWAMERYQAESFGGIAACQRENCPHGHCPRCGNCDDVLDNVGEGSEHDDNQFFCGPCGQSFGAESFSAELKRDSCCCGATKSNPCACMIKGVMDCSAVEPKCPCYAAKDAESFEAPREMEEEDFTPMDITQCHVCARPYEYSRIARALVQHYLKESKDGTMGWKTKTNPDGTRRTVRNIAGYQLYWHGLGAIDNYMGEGKISRMTPLIIELLRTAIVPNIIAGDVVQFIESMEIDDIEDTDPKFFTDFSDTWEAPNDRLKPERPSDDTGDRSKYRNKPKKPWRAETESSK